MNPHIPLQKKEWFQACHKIKFASECAIQQSVTEKCSGHYTLSSAHYTAIQMKNSMRSVSCNNYENMGDKVNSYHYSHREVISHYYKSTPCIVNEKNWDTKEDEGRSVMCVLYMLQLVKSMFRD